MFTDITVAKTALAKLLATENVKVSFSRHYETAFFDLQTRTIHIPLLTNIVPEDYTGNPEKAEEDLLDLFTGHEVGHAIETPLEGLHNSIVLPDGTYDDAFKSYLNVVEDVRIERLIKNRYPGLKPIFLRAYKLLYGMNFFTPKGEHHIQETINHKPFIDKLNCYSKIGSNILIDLSDEEQALINEAYALETFDEVVAYTRKIYNRQAQINDQMMKVMSMLGDGLRQGPPQTSQSQAGKQRSESQSMNSNADGEDSEDGVESDQDGDGSESNNQGKDSPNDSAESRAFGNVEASSTDKAFRSAESQMMKDNAAKNKSQRNHGFVSIPRYNLSRRVINAKDHNRILGEDLERAYVEPPRGLPQRKGKGDYNLLLEKLREAYRKDNQSYVNTLIKEFELRKNARKMSHGKMSKSGKLDVSKLHKYKLSDDIFTRVMSFPEGKNHGMVMYMDLSASMTNVMTGVFNQILILADFCTKLHIPFKVIGFCSSHRSSDHYMERLGSSHPFDAKIRLDRNVGSHSMDFMHNLSSEELNSTLLPPDYFHLKEYISSDMKAKEYKAAFDNLLVLKLRWEPCFKVYGNSALRNRIKQNYGLTDDMLERCYWMRADENNGESLHSTPLAATIAYSMQITKDFVAKHNIDNMINIVLSDGADNAPDRIPAGPTHYGIGVERQYVQNSNGGYFTKDSISGIVQHYDGTRYSVNEIPYQELGVYHLVKMARKVTGANYVSFFLADSHRVSFQVAMMDKGERLADRNGTKRWHVDDGILSIYKTKLKNDKYLVSTKFAYNTNFIVLDRYTVNSDVDTDQWWDKWSADDAKKPTTKAISKVFMQSQNQKHLSKIMLSKFARSIAEAV